MTIRTLLVDDNRTFLSAVRNFLRTLIDVEVVAHAHDGATALALAKRLEPDLVLLDIVMPEMGGLEVAAALQTLSVPPRIVLLSMHDSQAYRTAARELGARGYVGKGDFVVDLVPLIQQIARELQGHMPASVCTEESRP
ncbi:MAG: response regulator transcription factor [Burkholderiales bacterium]|nr:response regulator transcription factor [Burkholderiales bacterium]